MAEGSSDLFLKGWPPNERGGDKVVAQTSPERTKIARTSAAAAAIPRSKVVSEWRLSPLQTDPRRVSEGVSERVSGRVLGGF